MRPLTVTGGVVVAVSGRRTSRLLWVAPSESSARPTVVRSVDIPDAEITAVADLGDDGLLLLDEDGTLRRYSDDGQLSTIALAIDEAHPGYSPDDECHRELATITPLYFYGVETTPDQRFAVIVSDWGVLMAEVSRSDRWRAIWQLPGRRSG